MFHNNAVLKNKFWTNALSLNEGDVESGRVEVDKFEEKDFCGERVVVWGLSAVVLCSR